MYTATWKMIGNKQDEIRQMITELEDLIVEYDENDGEKDISDIEDMSYACDDIMSDIVRCSRKLDQISREIEE
jgi:hypothetical protein